MPIELCLPGEGEFGINDIVQSNPKSFSPGAARTVSGVFSINYGSSGAHLRSAVLGWDGRLATATARCWRPHALHQPFPRGRDVDENPVSDSREREPVGLI